MAQLTPIVCITLQPPPKNLLYPFPNLRLAHASFYSAEGIVIGPVADLFA